VLTDAFACVEAWQFVVSIRTSPIFYPLLSATHIVGLSLLFGAIAVYDLRVLRHGAAIRDRGELSVARIGFLVAVATGVLLFSVRATHYAENPAMQAKLALIVLALLNIAVFHRFMGGSAAFARIGAAISLGLWLAVILAGRFIGFA
jgi:hypothetical protein